MTITDVAREARVSVASVSRVVNGHANVLPETRQRITEVIDRLRYVPDTAARSLITGRTHMIGVLLPDLHGEFFSELIAASMPPRASSTCTSCCRARTATQPR